MKEKVIHDKKKLASKNNYGMLLKLLKRNSLLILYNENYDFLVP